MNKIYIVGMGPGFESMMTKQAIDALDASDVIVGYTVYIKLLGEKFQTKELLTTPMRQEKKDAICALKRHLRAKRSLLYVVGMPEYTDWHLLCMRLDRNMITWSFR